MKPRVPLLRRLSTLGSMCPLVTGVLLITCCPAYAYVDPGTGGLILQLLLGGVAGAAVVLKLYWEKVTGLFKRKTPEIAGSEQPDPNTARGRRDRRVSG